MTLTPDEYLDLEELSETKHMYYAGSVTAFEGVSFAHAILAGNLIGSLHNALRGRGYGVVGSGVLFRTGSGMMFTYPDAMVICGQVERVPGRPHVITNPVFVAEVLSPSTEAIDRGLKPRQYRATASIREYALISQDEPWVEIHTRNQAGWRISDVMGLEELCVFTGIDCVVPMAALYEGVLELARE